MTFDISTVRKQVQDFAALYAFELAAELIEWEDSGVLRDGRLREIAKLCAPLGPVKSLSIAENFARRAMADVLVAQRSATVREAAITTRIRGLEQSISDYWDLAQAEGREGRNHDTPDAAAQRKWLEIVGGLKALACMAITDATQVQAIQDAITALKSVMSTYREGGKLDTDEVEAALYSLEQLNLKNNEQ